MNMEKVMLKHFSKEGFANILANERGILFVLYEPKPVDHEKT